MVSYFNGIKTTEDKIFHEKMAKREERHASAYQYGIGADAPAIYKVPEDVHLDMPDPYRSTDHYTTTMGHKVQHKFEDTNVYFGIVDHPVFGPIVGLIATEEIDVDEEIFVNYGYGLEDGPKWYRDLHDDYN